MKKTLILVQAIGLVLLIACNSGKQGDKSGGKEGGTYGVKSGIITYKPMNMMGMTMTQTIYFDDYGKKETRDIVTIGSMMGQTIQLHAVDIREGMTTVHFELENIQNGKNVAKKEAYKEKITDEFLAQQNLAELSDELKKKYSFKEDGTETVAGIQGTRYTMVPDSATPNMIASGVHYKNIPLKFVMESIELIADKVELDIKVPAEKFKIPDGYTIVERNNSAKPGEDKEEKEE